jgi:hypothetical protein
LSGAVKARLAVIGETPARAATCARVMATIACETSALRPKFAAAMQDHRGEASH